MTTQDLILHLSQKIKQLDYEVHSHPSYSPDLSLDGYYLFRHVDHYLKGKIMINQVLIETTFKEFIASRQPDFYKHGIYKLLERWQKCKDYDGAYFL